MECVGLRRRAWAANTPRSSYIDSINCNTKKANQRKLPRTHPTKTLNWPEREMKFLYHFHPFCFLILSHLDTAHARNIWTFKENCSYRVSDRRTIGIFTWQNQTPCSRWTGMSYENRYVQCIINVLLPKLFHFSNWVRTL